MGFAVMAILISSLLTVTNLRENRRRDKLQAQSADDSIEKVTLDGLRDMTDRQNLRFRCVAGRQRR